MQIGAIDRVCNESQITDETIFIDPLRENVGTRLARSERWSLGTPGMPNRRSFSPSLDLNDERTFSTTCSLIKSRDQHRIVKANQSFFYSSTQDLDNNERQTRLYWLH